MRLQYIDGCPHGRVAGEHLAALAEELGFALVHQRITTPHEARRLGFRGSPTILVDGRDPFARGDEPTGLACRVFATPDGAAGSPTIEQLRSALT